MSLNSRKKAPGGGLGLQMAQGGLAQADAEGLGCAPASPRSVNISTGAFPRDSPQLGEGEKQIFHIRGAARGGEREENTIS